MGTRPLARADGSDVVWMIDKEAPGGSGYLWNGFVTLPDHGAELVLAQGLQTFSMKLERF
jgi:hypothetical protein